MRLGEASPKKLAIVVVLMALAAWLISKAVFFSAPPTAAAAPAEPTAAAGNSGQKPLLNSLDPSLRFDLLKSSESVQYKGNGRNIFNAEPEPPPVTKPIAPALVYGPPKPPPPPPINLKFYGFASGPGEPKRVFLSENGDIFIAKEGDIVDRRYKIGRIGPSFVEVTDVLNNNTQTIPLTENPAGAGPS